MKECLRKVQFNLGDGKCNDYSIGDRESDENGILKERYGLFHCWGEVLTCDTKTGKKYQETIAIVEEIGTGYVYKVNPNTFVFVKDIEK